MTKVIQKADVKSLLDRKDVDGLIEVLQYGGTRAMQMDAAVALGMIGENRLSGFESVVCMTRDVRELGRPYLLLFRVR